MRPGSHGVPPPFRCAQPGNRQPSWRPHDREACNLSAIHCAVLVPCGEAISRKLPARYPRHPAIDPPRPIARRSRQRALRSSLGYLPFFPDRMIEASWPFVPCCLQLHPGAHAMMPQSPASGTPSGVSFDSSFRFNSSHELRVSRITGGKSTDRPPGWEKLRPDAYAGAAALAVRPIASAYFR